MTKEFFITNNRFKYIGLILFLMFLVFMFLIYLKADELTHDPCQLCAKKMGESVYCRIGDLQRTFNPNFSVVDGSLGG